MFCQSCGAQVSGAFCTKCGAPAGQAPSPPQPPPPPQYTPAPPQYSQPLPPAAKSGAGLKILFVVLGVIAVLGMLFVGALMYGWHKVKETAASKGIDLNSFSETRRGPARRLDACDLLTKEDLSQILNLTVERSEGTGKSTHSTCRYYSAAAQQRGTDEAAAALKKLQETKSGNSPAQEEETLKDLGNVVRGVTTAAGAANAPMLSIEVETDNAKAAMAGFKIGMGLTGGVVGQGMDPVARKALGEQIPGLGDEAMMGPLLSLFMFRKGDVAVQVDGRQLPGGREAQLAIAHRILDKL